MEREEVTITSKKHGMNLYDFKRATTEWNHTKEKRRKEVQNANNKERCKLQNGRNKLDF